MTCELPTKKEVAEYQANQKRLNAIREDLGNLPMDRFVLVGEFMAFLRFIHCAASEEDLCLLERKIAEWRWKNSWCENCKRTIREDEPDHRC